MAAKNDDSDVVSCTEFRKRVGHEFYQFVIESVVNIGTIEENGCDGFVNINLEHKELATKMHKTHRRYKNFCVFCAFFWLRHPHILKTPNFVSAGGAFMAAEIPNARTMRVSAGSMMPSSQIRAVL